MTGEMAVVLAVVVIALVLFITERLPVDLVAVTVPAVLLVSGVLTAGEAVSGLAHPATVTVAAMLALSLGLLKTGAVATIGRWICRAPLGGPRLRLAALCLAVGAVSPFLSNTAVVVVFLPVFLSMARQYGQSPSSYLIPLSYSAILGGTVTVIGTSTNLVVHGIAEDRGLDGLTMFSITPLGLIYFGVGFLYLFTIGRWLLPERTAAADLSLKYDVRKFVTELQISEGSPVVNRHLDPSRWGDKYSVTVLGVQRGRQSFWGRLSQPLLRPGDTIYVQGEAAQLLMLAQEQALATPAQRRANGTGDLDDERLVELIVAPHSPYAGHTLSQLHFQERHDATVLAIQHHGVIVRERLHHVRLRPGDLLLVHGNAPALEALADDPGFVPMSEVRALPAPRPRTIVAIAIMAGVVGAAAMGWVSIMSAALVGVVLMLLSGCVRIEEVYAELDWMVVFLLAGLIPLGVALEKSGAAAFLIQHLASWLEGVDPVIVIGGFYLITSLITEVRSNNAAAIVLAPIAIHAARDLGINPYALLVATMFGASASFMTPLGYQTNAMVYGPGGYRFWDYLRVGGPLNLILLGVATLLIPMFWPS